MWRIAVEDDGEFVRVQRHFHDGNEILFWWDGLEFLNESSPDFSGIEYVEEINKALDEENVPKTWNGYSRRVKAPKMESVGIIPADWDE